MKKRNKSDIMVALMSKVRCIIIWIMLLVASNSYAAQSEEIISENKVIAPATNKVIKLVSTEYDQEEIKKTIDDASIEAKKNAEDAKKSLIEANKIVKKSKSSELIEIAKNRVLIEQSRKDIAKLQLVLARDLKETNKNLATIALALKEIEEKFLQEGLSEYDLKPIYQEAVTYWRILVDNSLKVFSKGNSELEIQIHNPENLFFKHLQDINDQDLISKYEDSYKILQTEYANILQLKIDLDSANKNYQSNLLLQSGKLRANILQKILSSGQGFINYDNGYADDLIRELKLIPYRPVVVFYSKILKYKQTIDSGFVGFMYILKQLGLLGVLIVILLVSKNTLAKLTDLFKDLGQFCVKQSISNKKYTKIALFLSTITPYFKWAMLLFIFSLASVILKNTVIAELDTLIPYFQYYFLYKIFRIFAHYNLNNFIYRNFEESSSRQSLNKKIRKVTKSLGIYLLSSVYLLHLTQTIVRKAYFYNLTLDLFLVGLFILLSIIASEWKDEIQIISKNSLSKKVNKIIAKLLSKRRSAVLFSLSILTILVFRGVIYKIFSFLRNYDFFKNLLSQIYRKKLESAAKRIDSGSESVLSNSYLKEFSKVDKDEKFILAKDHPYKEINNIINSWESEKSEENTIAIHGEKGIGKSRFLEKVLSDNNNFKILKIKFDKKITNKKDLLKIVSDLFKQDLTEKDLFKLLSSYEEKTIIVLEDCHNLFLAKEEGFEALKVFFNFLVKVDNPNLLWISTFNSFSWNYLQHSVKIGNYFRHILRLSRWSDENIRELIMNKHNRTGFKLIYDPLIFAISTNKSEKEFEDLQLKFFQIIWSQSRGNPTIAILLWLSSLNQGYGKTINISLPTITNFSHLHKLPEEHLFVYAAIVKHQNLSVSEISNILSITREEVFNIIRIGVEKGYLEESVISNKRFTTSCGWQTTINQLLINRNFIYAE